jgi:8-oxo-dGTP diphosphatase
MIDLLALQADAEAEGRRCLAGALTLDEDGRVFVHRRGWDRRLFPGCWDIVGGHLEPGETLLEALEREVAEETGWRLVGTPKPAYVADWETTEGDDVGRRREFDFVVEVEGDLARPRLERPKHVEFRWLGADDLQLLAENRGADGGGLVRHLVEVGLRYAHGDRLTYPHATAFVDTAIAGPVEALRAAWDPVAAGQIASHVTVVYPEECGDVDELVERVADAAAALSPFRLRLGRISHRDGSVFVDVDDVDRGWARLRGRMLGASRAAGPRPHATLVHPRTTNRGEAAWRAVRGSSFDVDFVVRQLAITAFDGDRWRTLRRIDLGG